MEQKNEAQDESSFAPGRNCKPKNYGLDRLAYFMPRRFWNSIFCFNRRLVCRSPKAVMESTTLALWPRLDIALRDDGRCGLAGLAGRRVEKTIKAAWLGYLPVVSQSPLDTTVFRHAPRRTCLHRHRLALGRDCRHAHVVLASEKGSRCFAGSIPDLGDIRSHP